MIQGDTKVYGLIGDPVAHSLSPLIQNALFAAYDLNSVYVTWPTGDPVPAVQGAYELGIPGLNVTVPHKQRVIPALADTHETALRIGAVNTLVRVPGGYRGYNTDVPGLQIALEEAGLPIRGERWFVLGAGGAARAAVYLLGQEGAADVMVANRTSEKAVELCKEMQAYFPETCYRGVSLEDLDVICEEEASQGTKKRYCIQCTSAGLAPHNDVLPVTSEAFYERVRGAYDMVYKPSVTAFVDKLRKMGVPAFTGATMLLYQGVVSFTLWTGIKPGKAVLQGIREDLLRAMGEGAS